MRSADGYSLRLRVDLIAVWACIGLFIAWSYQAVAQENEPRVVRSGPLVLEIDPTTGAVRQLEDEANDLSWHADGARVWKLDKAGQQLDAKLSVQSSHAGEAALTLTLHNPTDHSIRTSVAFPLLQGLTGGDPAALHYCFPRQDLILGDKPIHLDEPYSGRFPLQFLTAYQPGKGGIYLMTCDTDLHRKRYTLEKNKTLSMGATYPDLVVEPGQTLVLPTARLGVYSGDWHGAFDAYRRWVAQWYKPTVARQDRVRRIFHFRQVFLYPNLDTPGLFDPASGSLSIADSIDTDRERFGSIDYVHLFDWSQTRDQGRVGMYSPWHALPRDGFNHEIKKLHDQGLPVGLYFEGYLVSPQAKLEGRPGRAWQLRNVESGRYDPFGSGDDYICPGVVDWQKYLAKAVSRVAEEADADGFYIDQFGFGYQYPCYDPTHGHAVPSNQPREEAELIRGVREALNDKHILYTEQAPVDVATQFQDASFSYSMLHARNPGCPSRTNLLRFAFPDFKTIQILKGDGPIGDDVRGVHLVFYQGDGLWLVGPSDNPKWYSPRVLEAIRKTSSIRKQYLDAFTSEDVTPLVPTLVEDVYANRFVGKAQTVWTLYNASEQAMTAPVLRVRHDAGATYRDAWSEMDLMPQIEGGWAILEVPLDSRGIGCVVQTRSRP